MRVPKKIVYELRHVIDFRRPYITILVDTFKYYDNAYTEAQRLRKQSPGMYLIKRITTQILYCSKFKKVPS